MFGGTLLAGTSKTVSVCKERGSGEILNKVCVMDEPQKCQIKWEKMDTVDNVVN